MELHFKGTHYELGEDMTTLATTKLFGLKKYLGKREPSITHVYVELGKASAAHQSGDIWQAVVNFDVNGRRFHAQARAETLELAINRVSETLERELRSAKQKRESMLHQGGAMLKSLGRGFRR